MNSFRQPIFPSSSSSLVQVVPGWRGLAGGSSMLWPGWPGCSPRVSTLLEHTLQESVWKGKRAGASQGDDWRACLEVAPRALLSMPLIETLSRDRTWVPGWTSCSSVNRKWQSNSHIRSLNVFGGSDLYCIVSCVCIVVCLVFSHWFISLKVTLCLTFHDCQ